MALERAFYLAGQPEASFQLKYEFLTMRFDARLRNPASQKWQWTGEPYVSSGREDLSTTNRHE